MRTCMDTYVCMYALRAAEMHRRSGPESSRMNRVRAMMLVLQCQC